MIFFLHFSSQTAEIFHNDSKFAFYFPSSEFKSIINYIDAAV